MNHLKQLGLATVMYTADNEGYYPSCNSPDEWPQALRPNYENLRILVCPDDKSASSEAPFTASADTAPRSYVMNGWTDYFDLLPQPVQYEIMPESLIEDPSETIIYGEKQEGDTGPVNDFSMDLRSGNQADVLEQTRHGGVANYAFADGSARFLAFGKCLKPVNLWAVTPSARPNP